MTTLAGIASTYGSADGPGENATFMFPSGVAIDGQRNAVIVVSGGSAGSHCAAQHLSFPLSSWQADSLGHLIRRVDLASGVVSTLAGMDDGYADGVGSGANFSTPMSVAVGAAAEYAVIVRCSPPSSGGASGTALAAHPSRSSRPMPLRPSAG